MKILPNLDQREKEKEVMDDPSLDLQQHLQALRGLQRINWWSRTLPVVWKPIRRYLAEEGVSSLKVLDIATGGGDVPIRLWQLAQRAGVRLEVDGCDTNPHAVATARQKALQRKVPVKFFQRDVLTESIPSGYDVLMSSLFLHHLDEEETLFVLRAMRQAVGGLLLVDDLIRSRQGVALAYLGTRLLSTSAVVHTDGPRSVRGAYTVDEVRSLTKQAGLENVVISRHWPCRFLMIWRR